MKAGVGADQGGCEMKQQLAMPRAEGHEVVDFGNQVQDNHFVWAPVFGPLMATMTFQHTRE